MPKYLITRAVVEYSSGYVEAESEEAALAAAAEYKHWQFEAYEKDQYGVEEAE